VELAGVITGHFLFNIPSHQIHEIELFIVIYHNDDLFLPICRDFGLYVCLSFWLVQSMPSNQICIAGFSDLPIQFSSIRFKA